MVDSVALQAMPDQRVLAAGVQFRELASREELQEAFQHISPGAATFLKFRILANSDAEARHLVGHPRKDGTNALCGCGKRQPGWTDLRESTLLGWKRNSWFMALYRAQQEEPLMVAAVRLEGLAPAAVQQYERMLDPTSEVKDSTIRLAAKDVLEAVGLKQTEGVNVRHNAVANAESLQYRMAMERYRRGFELSAAQRELLQGGGVQLSEEPTVTVLDRVERTERSLDGEDTVVWDDGGDENEEYLPD